EIVLPVRAMLTAGITRETSPARCPAACGAAKASAGTIMSQERSITSPTAHGDFLFILDSPSGNCLYLLWLLEGSAVSIAKPGCLPTFYMTAWTHAPRPWSLRKRTVGNSCAWKLHIFTHLVSGLIRIDITIRNVLNYWLAQRVSHKQQGIRGPLTIPFPEARS